MLGAGTSASPWQVADYDDLKKVGRGYDAGDDATYALDDHYILTADIDASPSATENYSAERDVYEGWDPIATGFGNDAFNGHFDGDGHSITELHIDRGGSDVGMFSFIDPQNNDVTVQDLRVTGDVIASGSRSGLLVGYNRSGTIQRCRVEGTISNGTVAGTGGITGQMWNGTGWAGEVLDCSVHVDISSQGQRTGGAVGYNNGNVERTYSTGSVTSTNTTNLGGLIGENSNTAADNFYDSTTSGRSDTTGATGKTTTEMQDIDTYTDTATVGLTTAWDMTTEALHDGDPATATWFIDDGVDYPRLWFEYVASGDALTASLADTAGATDSIDTTVTEGGTPLTASLADTTGTTDALTTQLSYDRDIADTADLTDVVSTVSTLSRSLTDTSGVTDAVTTARIIERDIADTAGLTDSVDTIVQAFIVAAISDTVGVADAALVKSFLNASITDSVGISDSLDRKLDLIRGFADSLNLSDDAIRQLDSIRSITDTMNVTDALYSVVPQEIFASLTDTTGVTDSIDAGVFSGAADIVLQAHLGPYVVTASVE